MGGDSIYIDQSFLNDDLSPVRKVELRYVMIEEFLHAYINREMGAGEYLVGELFTGGDRHDWIHDKTAEIDTWLQWGMGDRPTICDY